MRVCIKSAVQRRHLNRRSPNLNLIWQSSQTFSNVTINKNEPKGEESLMDTVEKVRQNFDDLTDEDDLQHTSTWDDLWKNGLTPWDLGKATPVLTEELKAHRYRLGKVKLESESKCVRTLVPGCGSGYDLATLEMHNNWFISKEQKQDISSVLVGLDLSQAALERASKVVSQPLTTYETTSYTPSQVLLKKGNFFEDTSTWQTVCSSQVRGKKGKEGEDENDIIFDLIFDYTFFCALPPSQRPSWGKRMSELLRAKTGDLLTIMFPILPEDEASMKGPPYPVSIQAYRDALEVHGVFMQSEPYPSPHTVPSRAGKELVCWWKSEM